MSAPEPKPTHQAAVASGLDAAFFTSEEQAAELHELRLVVFSDHHRGSRDTGDDFLLSEPAYNAALGYYLETGYRTVLLGDVEELWENTPYDVLRAHQPTVRLEGELHRAGRYERLWGQHDDRWKDPRRVARDLHPYFPELRVRQAMRLHVSRGETPLGVLFFVHSGGMASDRLSALTPLLVRSIWRPLHRQGLAAVPDPLWQARHDRAVFEWARSNPERPVVIAGHTHRPVFLGYPADQAAVTPESLERHYEELHASGEASPERLGRLRAELEFAHAVARNPRPALSVNPPCYFNPGSCSSPDGVVSALELADAEIRLVRWSGTERPEREVVSRADLATVLATTAVDRNPAQRPDRISGAPTLHRRRPEWSRGLTLVTLLSLVGLLLGGLPVALVADGAALLGAMVIAWLVSAVAGLRRVESGIERRPHIAECVLAVASAVFPAGLLSALSLAAYGASYGIGELSDHGDPGGPALIVAAISALALCLGLGGSAAAVVFHQLFPATAGTAPAFEEVARGRRRGRVGIATACAVLGLGVVLVVTDRLWAALAMQVVSLIWSAGLFRLGASTRTRVGRRVADELADAWRDQGFEVTPSPTTGDPGVDPLIACVDLIARDARCGFVVQVKESRDAESRVPVAAAAALGVAASSLAAVFPGRTGGELRLEPVLVLAGADPSKALATFCRDEGVRIVDLPRQVDRDQARKAVATLVESAAPKVAVS